MDLSQNNLKPNKLKNWLISQEMLLGIIKLSLMTVALQNNFQLRKYQTEKNKIYL